MKLVILVYPGMTVLDAIGPYEVFNATRKFDICFAWKEAGPIIADSGVLALGATHALDEITDCDVLLVPGSAAETMTIMADQQVLEWLRGIHGKTTFTTSVCSGALILGAAGLLKGLPATTHWAGIHYLKQFGASARPDDRIVREGKVVTAAGVSAGIDLALYLLGELLGPEEAKIAQLMIEYDPQPPFDSGHMSKAEPEIARQARLAMTSTAAMNPRNLLSVPKMLLQRWRRALRKTRK